MLGFSFLVAALAILVLTVVCHGHNPFAAEYNIKRQIEGDNEEYFRQECKKNSGVDVDIQRNERIYKDFEKCIYDLVDDPVQMMVDIQFVSHCFYEATPTEQQQNDILASFRKYCPVISAVFNCESILSPIYNECTTATANEKRKFEFKQNYRVTHLICENNAERGVTLVNGKFLECNHFKTGYNECEAQILTELKGSTIAVESWRCTYYDEFKSCIFSKIGKCNLSKAVFTTLESLYTKSRPDCTIDANVQWPNLIL